MAQVDELSIYNDTMAFILLIYKYVNNFNSFDRGVLGARLLNESLDLISYISLANREKDKREEHLTNYLSKFESIKACLKICSEVKIMSERQTELLCRQISKIEKQATGWKNHKSRKKNGLDNTVAEDYIQSDMPF